MDMKRQVMQIGAAYTLNGRSPDCCGGEDNGASLKSLLPGRGGGVASMTVDIDLNALRKDNLDVRSVGGTNHLEAVLCGFLNDGGPHLAALREQGKGP